jgi:hypothetical protein
MAGRHEIKQTVSAALAGGKRRARGPFLLEFSQAEVEERLPF